MGSADVLGPTVDRLAEFAGTGAALEMAVGTGRIALPSPLAAYRSAASSCLPTWWRSSSRPGGDGIPVTLGDMTTTLVEASGSSTSSTTRWRRETPGPTGRLFRQCGCPSRAWWLVRDRDGGARPTPSRSGPRRHRVRPHAGLRRAATTATTISSPSTPSPTTSSPTGPVCVRLAHRGGMSGPPSST